MKKIFALITLISACSGKYPWKGEVRQLLVEGTAFLQEFTAKLEGVSSAEEANHIMRTYRLQLLNFLERHNKLVNKYPEISRKEFPMILSRVLPQESSAFISAFQRANSVGEKVALKYKSPEFSQEAKKAWQSLFDAFQMR